MRILRKILRGIAWTALSLMTLVVVAVIVALLWARSDSGRARIRSIVLEQGRKSLPGLDVQRIGGDFTRSIELYGIRIRDHEGRDAVSVDRVAVRYNLLALLRHKIVVESLAVEHPVLVVRPGEDGRLNVTELVAPSPEQKKNQKPSTWALDVGKVELSDGEADVVTTAGAHAHAHDLHLDATLARNGEDIDATLHELGARARYQDKPYSLRILDTQAHLSPTAIAASLRRLEVEGAAPGGMVVLSGNAGGPREHVDLDLDAFLPASGEAKITGSLAVGQPEPHYDITVDGRNIDVIKGIDVHHVLAHAKLDGQKLDASVKATLASPHHGGGNLEAHATGTLPDRLSIEARGSGQNLTMGKMRIGQFQLAVKASDVPQKPRGTVHVGVRRLDLAPDTRLDTLDVDGASDGHRMQARVSARGPQQQADLALHGTLAKKKLDITIDRLQAALPQAKIALLSPAAIHLVMGKQVAVDHTHVRVDTKQFGGELAVRALYRFRASRLPRLQASIALRNGVALKKQKVEANTTAEIDQKAAHATIDASFGPHRTPLHVDVHVPVVANRKSGFPQLATKGPLLAHLTAKNLALDDLPMDLERQGIRKGSLELSAVVEGFVEAPKAHADIKLHDLEVNGLANMGAELSLETSPDRTKLSGRTTLRNHTLVALEGDTPLSLKHVLAKAPLPDLPLAVSVHAPAIDLADFAPLSTKLEGYGGIVRLAAKVSGTLKHPQGEAQMGIAGAHVDQLEFGPMTFDAHFDDRQLTANFSTVAVTGGGMQARAVIQRAPGYPVDVRFESRDLDITFVRAMTPGLRDLGGILTASLHVTGPARQPVLTGNLKLEKGVLGIVGEPTFHDVTAQMVMQPGTIGLEKLHMRSGDGHFDAHGLVRLNGTVVQSVSLQANADDFRIAMGGTGSARLRGQFAIEAAQRQDVLSGKVEIPNARVWLPKMISSGKKLPKTVTPPDLIFVDRAGLKQARKEAEKQNVSGKEKQEMDISAKLGTLYVQSKDMNLEITADTQVKTGPTGQPAISGTVTVRRGHIMIKDQRFDFDRGEIMFDGTEQVNPGLDIQLSHEYPDVTAIIQVHGTMKHPELRFTSDPPIYDQSGVIGLIMSGGQVGGDPSATQFNAEAAVTNALLGALADNLAPSLGLDVLRVGGQQPQSETGAQGDTDTRVEVGKYLSPRVYLSFVHVFGSSQNENNNEAHVEYRMTRRWMMETAFGDAGVGGIDFLWTYRY